MALTFAVVLYIKHLNGNINHVGFDTDPRPAAVPIKGDDNQPMNVLVMGSDTRAGANGRGIGGKTPGLSDTTMILHLSADRAFAYGISLPRDAMVIRPRCEKKDHSGWSPGGLIQFNEAYGTGGPACTVKTVEQLTGIRINHFIVVDFVGFRAMVNAIGGVQVCVPRSVHDTVGHIDLPAGTYNMTGQQALDYVRVRHDIGAPTGDIGRMKRQQAFISSMIKKVVSAGTLANVPSLISFLEAATKSLTTDPQTDVTSLASIGNELRNIGLDKIQFITVPWQPYAPDPNRVEWKPSAAALWKRVIADERLGPRFSGDAVSPGSGTTPSGKTPSGTATGTPTSTPTSTAAAGGTPTKSAAEKQREQDQAAQAAQAAGLCTSKN
jgi:LCP family protein required for cell wall assembly